MRKRLFSLLLSLCLVLSLLPFGASAAEIVDSGVCGEHLTWTLDADGLLTISGEGAMTSYGEEDLDSPFYYHSGVRSIVIEPGVTSIGDYAFYRCGAKSIVIPDTVTSIGARAMQECGSLTSLTIPDSVTRIGEGAFMHCDSLPSVTIPGSVKQIGEGVFADCTQLTEAVIQDGVQYIGDWMFSGCTGLRAVSIPDSVKWIGAEAFHTCRSLNAISIPENVPNLDSGTFYGCTSLETITLPEGIESIGMDCFRNCTALKEISLPQSLMEIDQRAFQGASALTDVYYNGSAVQWDEIRLEVNGNDPLLNAQMHFAFVQLEIISGPQSVTAEAGEKVVLSVDASGDGLTYQWQYTTYDGGTWKNSSLKNADYVIFTARTSYNGRYYRCVVTDAYGNQAVSEAALLTVTAPLEIISQPQSVTAKAGETVKFDVEATGVGLHYQWQLKTPTGTWKNTTSSGAKTASLSVAARLGKNGYQYRCVITDVNGNQAFTEPATLTVYLPLEIISQPQSVTVNTGETAELSVEVFGEGLTYQWQYSTDDGETWKNSTLSRTCVVRFTAKASYDGRRYRCVINDEDGNQVISEAAVLTVCTPLCITAQPKSVVAEPGEAVKLRVTAQGDGLTYQWQIKTPQGDWQNSTAKSGKTAALSVSATRGRNGYRYRCVITDRYGEQLVSDEALLAVAAKIEILSQPKSVIAAPGSSVKFTVAAQGSGLTYQWQLKTPTGDWQNSTAKSGKTAKLSVSVTTGKNCYQYRCVITDVNGNQVVTEPALLAVWQNV